MKAIGMLAAGVFMAVGVAAPAADPARPDPKLRIQWTNRLVPAFETAVKEKKPLVVFFRKDFCDDSDGPCRHCRPVEDVLLSEVGAAFADQGFWVWQTVGVDDGKKNQAKLMKELKIESVPTLVVLEASRDELKEKGRIVGKFSPDAYRRKLRELFGGQAGAERDKSTLVGW